MQYKKNEEAKSRYKRLIKLYSKMLLNNDIDYQKLKNIYDRTIAPEYAEFKIKQIVRQRESQKLIESEILAEYELQGVTAKSIIQEENNLKRLGIENKSYTVSDRIIERQGKRIGLDPKEVRKSITVTVTDYKRMLAGNETKQIADGDDDDD